MSLILGNLLGSAHFVNIAKAQDKETLGGLTNTATAIGYNKEGENNKTDQVSKTVGYYINIVLSFIGLIFFVIIWLGAFDIVGANGDEQLFQKGKDRIKNGAIGILIVFIAYLFTKVVLGMVGEGIFI